MSEHRRLVAEFNDADAIGAAIRRIGDHAGIEMQAYTPFPLTEIEDALTPQRSRVSTAVFAGGIAGAVLGAAMEYLPSTWLYPINVGGRPLAAWPAFGPILFQTTVGAAVVAGFLGFLIATRLPRYYHPIFAVPHFVRASQDRFFLAIAFDPERLTPARARKLLEDCDAAIVHEVGDE